MKHPLIFQMSKQYILLMMLEIMFYFDDDQGNDYLCNLRNKTYKKFILPKKFRDDTQMYLAGKEKKMLVQHRKRNII